MADPQQIGLSAYELNMRLLEKASQMGASLEQIAANLERLNTNLERMANDDPLSRVERALERAPDALGFDPFTDRNPEPFDHRFAGRPIEEQMR